MKKIYATIAGLIFVAAVAYLAAMLLLPSLGRMSSSPKHAITCANLRSIAMALVTYQREHQQLPSDLKALISPDFLPKSLTSPFDSAEIAFRYSPSGWHLTNDIEPKSRILAYCTSPIPQALYSADGESSPGLVPALYNDFEVRLISFEDRAALDAMPLNSVPQQLIATPVDPGSAPGNAAADKEIRDLKSAIGNQ